MKDIGKSVNIPHNRGTSPYKFFYHLMTNIKGWACVTLSPQIFELLSYWSSSDVHRCAIKDLPVARAAPAHPELLRDLLDFPSSQTTHKK